jgi:beta-aspartyl-peptidase (threonine type)
VDRFLLKPFVGFGPQIRKGKEMNNSLQRLSVLLSAIFFCSLGAGVQAQTAAPKSKSAEAHIRALLDAQTRAWNEGKLEEFMEGYWRSPQLTFFSAGRKLEGWDATIERYRKTYQGAGNEMGKTTFSELDVQLLGPEKADGKELGGLFTLIFRKFRNSPFGGWKIVHDHTSSNQ